MLRAWYNQNRKESRINYQAGIDLNKESGTGKRIQDQKQQIGDYAAFVSLKFDPVKAISLQPGARAIYNTKYAAPIVYSMNVKWAPAEKWALRATYARGFTAPELKELYLYFVDINHNVRGNPDLKAEYSHTYSLDLSYNHESAKAFINAEVCLFYNNINNNITLSTEVNINLYTYINVGKFISRGVQANVSWSLYPALTLKTGYSATAQSFAFDASSIRKAGNNWNRDLTGSLVYKMVTQKITLSLFYKYSGKTPQVVPNDDRTISVRWVNDFHTLDLTVMRSFLKNHFTVSAGGKNLFDVKTVPAVGATGGAHSGGSASEDIAWGRTYFVKLSFNFNTYE